MNICIYGASSNIIDDVYIKDGESLGSIIAKRGHGIVYGGGAEGMMGAVARGVSQENGSIIGKGNHAELLECCPEYKAISDSQMGGAFVE